ncbi:hypothetical protein ACRAWF_25850 [Streptomyces sp. L7]
MDPERRRLGHEQRRAGRRPGRVPARRHPLRPASDPAMLDGLHR